MSSSQSHDPAHSSTKVILIALAANLGIALSKFVGWFFTASASLLAEAIHSLADCTNQILLLVGNKASAQAPDDDHPLGHGRESFFWSFVVALILFSMGGLFSIYEGIHKFEAAEPVEHAWVGIAILFTAIALEGGSFFACLREVRQQNPYGSLAEWIRRTTSTELLVIFTEDLAALVGLVLALAALMVATFTGDSRWDAAGSIAIGVVLVTVAVVLARETKSLLIGEAPSKAYEPEIARIVAELIPGGRVLRFIAQQVGVNHVLVTYKVHPGSVTDVARLIECINSVERRVRERFPEIQWQFVEPDFEA